MAEVKKEKTSKKKVTSTKKVVSEKKSKPTKVKVESSPIKTIEKPVVKTNSISANTKNVILSIIAVVLVLGIIILPEVLRDSSKDRLVQQSANPLLTEPLPEGQSKELKYISYTEFEEVMNNEQPTFVMVGSPRCSWCTYETPIVEHIAYLYNVELMYLNTDEFTTAEKNKLQALDTTFTGTPSHYIVQNGKIINILPGAHTQAELEKFLKEATIIS